ncbi:zinc finger protein 488 isoform X2 [Puntigrus tetrazona]|uniref:zinc finger protein 488 isoform X2 n=1 Tax=Puntigrus tetrazona TaxID=1606681 RepID=UPI001C89494E|nr:zinc finger protein 488 isoform X2 [Puntigrus tetrazona]
MMDPAVTRPVEESLEAYMRNRHLSFRAIEDIPLVWYGRDLTKLLDLSTQRLTTQGLTCSECKQGFLSESKSAHKRFFCVKKPTSFLKKTTVPEVQSSKPATNFHNLARELESCRTRGHRDARSPKRRRSVESDPDESDSDGFSISGGPGSPTDRSAFTRASGHVQALSAFTQPPPRIPVTSAGLTRDPAADRTPVLPILLHAARLWPRTPPRPPSLSVQNRCARCSVSFHVTSDLVQHMRSHHKRALSGDQRLKCPGCKETFRERHHLSRHMTSHT